MHSIGRFSRLTRLSVKMLRHYHEIGLLEPDEIDTETGYRYYGERALHRARVIVALKEIELPLKDIAELLTTFDDDADVIHFLEHHRREIEEKIAHYVDIRNSLDAVMASVRTSAANRADASTAIEERTIEPMLFAGVRICGEYSQLKEAFSTVGRRAGFSIAGPATGLFYDEDYKESGADFEGGFSVKKRIEHDDVDCRELAGGLALTLTHRGSYDTIHDTYVRLLTELDRLGVTPQRPSREVYLEGPGLIFRGNPEKYRTEIQFLLE